MLLTLTAAAEKVRLCTVCSRFSHERNVDKERESALMDERPDANV